jgi:lipid-binding SYLF domain-containing protein
MKMKKMYGIPLALVIILSAAVLSADASDKFSQTIEVYKKSPQAQPFFKTAYGYAVFPTIGKGAFVVGAAAGEGRVYRQGKATGKSTLVKMSVGFQAGGQAFSQMVFFQDERAYNDFTSGEFTFDASASAVAITAGAQARAGTGGAAAGASAGPATGAQAGRGYTKGMAVFVHTKGGLMYEAAIGGQKFSFQPFK